MKKNNCAACGKSISEEEIRYLHHASIAVCPECYDRTYPTPVYVEKYARSSEEEWPKLETKS